MSDPFLAEVIMFAGNFAPRSWAYCNGQLLPISQYSAVYSLLGTTYGGDGRTTFALPDLRGRVPVHSGGNSAGPGLTPRQLGSRGGQERVTLTIQEMPSHSHDLQNNTIDEDSNLSEGGGNVLGESPNTFHAGPGTGVLGPTSTQNRGGSQSHENMPPFLALNFIIALSGVFPSRN
ncbi:MAG: tail fiber protein [Fuerstiella sp.]